MKTSSFSEETKIELMDPLPKAQCCRKALAYGIFCNSLVDDPEKIIFETDSVALFEVAKKLATEIFGGFGEIETVIINRKKKYRTAITKKRPKETILKFRLSDDEISEAVDFKCPHCAAAFAKGVFLSSGSITNPNNSYHLELAFSSIEMLEKAASLLFENGINMRTVQRKDHVSLYCKESSVIEDFIAFIGAKRSMFEIMNSKIIREIRNNENRIANCEANNIAKAVSASGRHIDAIEKLRSMDRLSVLPSELRETAELRVKYKSLSLSELGAMMNPPISKSGINHRLNKIIEIAEKI